MFKDINIQKMVDIMEQITDAISDNHKANIFWSPKTNSDNGRVSGFRLYAYGGYVLSIFVEADRVAYKTNFHVYKDNYFEDLWDEEFDKKLRESNLRKSSKNADTLLGITDLWETVLKAYKKRMYGEGNCNRKYMERGRGTTIARNIELHSEAEEWYVIEQESRIKVSKKKPDLIGVRNENNKTIISFIEYKCTKNGMNGVTITEHFEDMVKFYKCETLYEQVVDFAILKFLQLKSDFKIHNDKDGEIVFLFSNIGEETGFTAQKIYNDVCHLIYECKEYPEHKDHVKFIILKNEKELYSPSDYMDANTFLKQPVFAKCDKNQWKKTRKKMTSE